MAKLISFMHISLDGFVCGPNGEMNWIKIDEQLFDYVEQRIGKTNTAMYGHKTYQMMQSYWPTAGDAPNASKHDINHSRWYKNAHKIVLSRQLNQPHDTLTNFIHEPLAASIQDIKKNAGEEILIFGSPSATHSLMQANLVDGFWLFVNPVVLGKGIRLFAHPEQSLNLKKIEPCKQFDSGVIELNYLINT